MPLNPNGNLIGTNLGDLLWGRALVLGDGGYDNYSDTGTPGALFGYGGDDTIYGDIYYDGDDGIEGDEAHGGDGNDLIYGDTGPQAGADWKLGLTGGSDRLYGDAGNDTIFGEHGNDQLYGGTGDDGLIGGWGSDVLRGEDGHDVIYTDQDSLTLLHATGWYNSAWGGAGNDTIIGGRGVDEVYGDLGNDSIRGLAGNDDLEGGDGADYIFGGDGDDLIDGGGYYASSADASDNLFGEAGNDTIFGGYGHDRLYGGDGIDRLVGGDGNDVFSGNAGADIYDCGAGNDLYFLEGGDVFRFEYADTGIDTLASNTNRTLGAYHENLTLLQGTAAWAGSGNALNNTIMGNTNANLLRGGGGNDVLNGFYGNDSLIGGMGADRLIGGESADRFIFNSRLESTYAGAGRDVITDFSLAEGDRIDLRVIDARTTMAGDQAFSFIGGAAFTGVAGQLRCQAVGTQRWISADVNGDRVADFGLFLDDPLAVTSTYFLL
ncbi:calcium-binding protein [uncultured Paracoccus sp.]|uniref:calcium-binding protein n=1 Tax=uncultured Paracoccus sp. TaxID=189685 RepID=UPI0026095A49|nr:calcium-binding protein [uncultured Paracoccus sp.]